MTDEPKQNAMTVFTIESLDLMKSRRDELEASEDHHANRKELMLYSFIISKLQADYELHKHLAETMHRLDALERERGNDHEIVAAVLRDAAETRRLTLAATERVDVLAANVNAAMDEMARVSGRSEAVAKALTEEAKKAQARQQADEDEAHSSNR